MAGFTQIWLVEVGWVEGGVIDMFFYLSEA